MRWLIINQSASQPNQYVALESMNLPGNKQLYRLFARVHAQRLATRARESNHLNNIAICRAISLLNRALFIEEDALHSCTTHCGILCTAQIERTIQWPSINTRVASATLLSHIPS
jgi:hypothetical protein